MNNKKIISILLGTLLLMTSFLHVQVAKADEQAEYDALMANSHEAEGLYGSIEDLEKGITGENAKINKTYIVKGFKEEALRKLKENPPDLSKFKDLKQKLYFDFELIPEKDETVSEKISYKVPDYLVESPDFSYHLDLNFRVLSHINIQKIESLPSNIAFTIHLSPGKGLTDRDIEVLKKVLSVSQNKKDSKFLNIVTGGREESAAVEKKIESIKKFYEQFPSVNSQNGAPIIDYELPVYLTTQTNRVSDLKVFEKEYPSYPNFVFYDPYEGYDQSNQ